MPIIVNYNQNERPHITAGEILMKMRHSREAHERYTASAGSELQELADWQKCLKERKFQLVAELDSTIEAIEQLNEAITRLLEHAAYCHGYKNAEVDLAPIPKKRGTANVKR